MSMAEMRNTSGFLSCCMTNAQSIPLTPDRLEQDRLTKTKNRNLVNMDTHANIHVWESGRHLDNVRKVKPIRVTGFGGFSKLLDTVGDHPLLGEVFIDPDNAYNIISCDLIRMEAGYLRRTSKDNMKEYLYNDDLHSVLCFERDPSDGFYKMSINKLNDEMKRCFPRMCYAMS